MRLQTTPNALLLGCFLLLLPVAAMADFRLERELALAPGGTLVLDTEAGSVTVRGTARSGVRVLVTSPREDIEQRFVFSFEEGADRVTVKAERRARGVGRLFAQGREVLQFAVEVPADAAVDVETSGGRVEVASVAGEVRLHTSGGPVALDDLAGPTEARTSGGPIEARDLGATARLHTSGGPVAVERVAGDLEVHTSGGPIRIEEAGGRVEAHTSGGPVTVRFAPGNSSGGLLSTSGGRVVAHVDPAAALDIDASTSGGSVILDLPVTVQGRVTSSAVRGRLNGGGAELKMRSSGGSIQLASL